MSCKQRKLQHNHNYTKAREQRAICSCCCCEGCFNSGGRNDAVRERARVEDHDVGADGHRPDRVAGDCGRVGDGREGGKHRLLGALAFKLLVICTIIAS